jgi:DUF971 family protein
MFRRKRMTAPPSDIKARQSEGLLELVWDENSWTTRLPYTNLRAECPCAGCKDEWTGARILDPATIDPDIKISEMDLVGSYALKIAWTDGHSSGLFTWENLRKICEAAKAASTE